jgi:hypothetical protein
MTPDPKPIRIRLTPAGRMKLKEKLYYGRANYRCETCKRWVQLVIGVNFNPLFHAHLSHNRHGSNKEDTEEGCKIECPECHDRKHRGL